MDYDLIYSICTTVFYLVATFSVVFAMVRYYDFLALMRDKKDEELDLLLCHNELLFDIKFLLEDLKNGK